MKFSGWAPYGLLKYKGGEYTAKVLHGAMIRLFGGHEEGGFSGEVGSFADAFSFATAHVLALADAFVQRVWRQRFARTVYENLAAEEEEHGIQPGPGATILGRRRVLAARKRIPEGSRRAALEEALRTLLGDAYVGVHITRPDEVVRWPTNLGDSPQNLQEATVERKLIRIVDTISIGLGAPQTVTYEGVLPETLTEHSLDVGDTLLVEPEILGRAEVVTVTAIGMADEAFTFTATFDEAHEPSCLATTAPMPVWTSSQCEILVVVTQAAVVTIETRRQIHELLERILTAVTTWGIAQESAEGSGTAGPFTTDDPVLGLTDANPLGEATVP